MSQSLRSSRVRATALLLLIPFVVAAGVAPATADVDRDARWKINTHLFAANLALADALNDGMVTIPPFGEFPVAASALRALREAPAAYRAGVLAPDLFPDMYVGGWFIHSDLSQDGGWIADDWIRHVWAKGRAWADPAERNKVLAFTYGFLTHGAGDIFAHTWVNAKADGAWVSFWGKDRSTAFKHIVLEGFVGEHTPATDLTLDVWPRYVSNILIKDADVRRRTSAAHYRRWLAIYDALPKAIDRAKKQMNNNVHDDAPYWVKCSVNPVACARKEQAETWRLDINRGLRALVDSSESLGEMLMDHSAGAGVSAMTGWASEWVPKMFGAHALGEGMAALQDFMQWAGDLIPIDSIIQAEVHRFLQQQFPGVWAIYEAAQKPSYWMEQPGLFEPGTKAAVSQEMGVRSGGSTFDWRAFEPIYNSVILSKLVLLDGDGLNELARRAGVSTTLFAPGEASNVMLGVFRSMTQSYQWTGEVRRTDTRFGICGPETGDPLPLEALCGVAVRRTFPVSVTTQSGGGFAFYANTEARSKVFEVIFKGFGVGPGSDDRTIASMPVPPVAVVRDGRRALRSASGHAEHMREIVALMGEKVAGVDRGVAAAPVAPTVRGRSGQPAAAAPAAGPITDWGARCCSRDIAALRSALAAIQMSGQRLQNAALLNHLGRRASATQLAARAAQIQAALNAFANTRDAASAAAALAVVARQVDALAAVISGVQ